MPFFTGLLILISLLILPAQQLQAQCESSPPECQPDMTNGHGPDPCMAKIYCSNSGKVESGLIACTNAADTDGCGIEAFSASIGVYAEAESSTKDLFANAQCDMGQYVQWMVFATPPTVEGTTIQGVGASDSWFLFHAGSFTIDESNPDNMDSFASVYDALADPARCGNFDVNDLVACKDTNPWETWTNPDAVIGEDVYNVYYIAFFYDDPTNGSLNFKVKECEFACPEFVTSCPADLMEDSCQSEAEIDTAFEAFLADFSAEGGLNASVEWFVDGQSVGMTKPGLDLAPDVCGGSVTIGYEITDDCNDPFSCEASFSVSPPSDLNISTVADKTVNACDYADQDALDAAFATWIGNFSVSGGCDPQGSDLSAYTAPDLCAGGSTEVTFNVTDLCESGQDVATFSVTPPSDLVISNVADKTVNACDYADQDALDAAFATWIGNFGVSGGCDPQGNYLSGYTAPDLCAGGSTEVTFNVTDLCESGQDVAIFTVTPPSDLSDQYCCR